MPQVKHYGCFQFKAHLTETRIAECFQAMVVPCLERVVVFDFNLPE